MKNIKIKPARKTPRVLTDAACAPKELARKSMLAAQEKIKESAEQPPQQNETPTEYAETRIEYAASDITQCSTQTIGDGGKQLVQKLNEARKQNRFERGMENDRSPFLSENNTTRQGRDRVRQVFQNSRRAQQSARQSVKNSRRHGQDIAARRYDRATYLEDR